MKKTISIFIVTLVFIFSGCARQDGIAYDPHSYQSIKKVLKGDVVSIRDVYIKDDGTGTFVGAIIGTVIGSTIGKGDGETLASLGGGILGGVLGSAANEKNAQELTVELQSGKIVVVVSKGTVIMVGDSVNIVTEGDRAVSVYKTD